MSTRPLLLLFILIGALLAAVTSAHAAAYRLATNGRDEVIVSLAPNDGPQRVELPQGLVLKTAAGARVITLRAAKLELAGGGQAEGVIPSAALASQNARTSAEPAEQTPENLPALAPLLQYLATRDDVPRLTSQCVVLALLENLDFHAWQTFLRSGAAPDEAAQAKAAGEAVARAVDAMVILRSVYPDRDFRLYQDEELKLRALRQPGTRSQAQYLYGLSLPPEAAPPSAAAAQAPNLGQLFHTSPGDNCPICRMRQQMQKPADNL